MNKELNRYISVLEVSISFEQAKKMPDVDRLQLLEENLFYLQGARTAMQWVDIEFHAKTAEALCNKSEDLLKIAKQIEPSFTESDIQGLYVQ